MRNAKHKQQSSPQSTSRFIMAGFVFILILSFGILPKLPYLSGGIGWWLSAAFYGLLVGLLAGGWSWFAGKYMR